MIISVSPDFKNSRSVRPSFRIKSSFFFSVNSHCGGNRFTLHFKSNFNHFLSPSPPPTRQFCPHSLLPLQSD